ncbi:MAG: signal peptide peptidase SppA [Anaerolineae bacterium]|jgi:protease-4
MKPFDLVRNTIRTLRNAMRSLRRRGLDWVILPFEGSFPERAPRRAPLPFPFSMLPLFPPEVSLEEMQQLVDVVKGDGRVRGVILRLDRVQAGAATLYTLRRMIRELRASGKHTIAWLPAPDSWNTYLASACDQIVVPPSARLNVLGLRSEALFMKETLALIGVEADLESIAEYKVAPDMFRRATMTEPHREMLDAILDSYFDELVTAIAEGRGLTPERVRDLIDRMPMGPEEAIEADLIDAIAYEDELGALLPSLDEPATAADSRTTLTPWGDAARWLQRPVEWTTRKRIGVVSVEGMIVPGKSRRMPTTLPLPVEAQAGSETLSRVLRQAEADPHIAAVILHVDSPGGSSAASDLIWREVQRLRERKPVVALMGGQAASGGYYVSAAANHIVARPTTMTGSIGTWGGKFVVGKLYDRLELGREEITRGAMAGFTSELRPFSDEEREKMRRELGETYARFRQIVAEGRGMTEEEVEEIARGRVWTGAQATAIGLVDELGDFQTALAAAQELAGLDPEEDTTVVQITPPGKVLPPMAFPSQGEPAWMAVRRVLQDLARERVWAMAPWTVRVQG